MMASGGKNSDEAEVVRKLTSKVGSRVLKFEVEDV